MLNNVLGTGNRQCSRKPSSSLKFNREDKNKSTKTLRMGDTWVAQYIFKNEMLSTNFKQGQIIIRFVSYKSHCGFYLQYGLAWDKNDVMRSVSSSCER